MNKKKMFSGWKQVFHFTFQQATKGKGFKMATFGVSILLCLALLIINVVLAESAKEKKTETSIEQVVLSNDTDISVDFSSFAAVNTEYKGIQFKNKEQKGQEIKADELKEHTVEVQIAEEKDSNGYLVKVFYPGEGEVSEDQAQEFAEKVKDYFQNYKIAVSGASQEQIKAISTPLLSEITTAGKQSKGIGEMMFRTFAPMIVYFLLYFMLISYGQSISKVIISEKSSKVMELLLTSVKPYAVITGKIVGMTCVAILQLCSWIAGGILGFAGGNLIGKQLNPDYQNGLLQIINLIRDNSDGNTFSVSVLIVSVLILFFGFFFYCVLAGLAASTVSKPEELSNAMSIFMIPVVLSFLAVYALPIFEEAAWIKVLLRYLPFTGAFCIPADLLVGNLTITGVIVPLLIMILTTFVLITITGKIYKKKIF